jgi:hypothetical protein
MAPKPYKFIGFGAMDVTIPYKIYKVWGHTWPRFAVIHGPKPYKIIRFRGHGWPQTL